MSERLKGYTALITGGSSGLGFEMAKALLGQGATVVIAARGRERLEKAREALAEAGDAGGLYLAFAELLYPRETYEKLRGLLGAMAESVTEEELEKFRILAEGIRGFSATEALGRIHCPVLALGDKQDRVFGASVEETARRMSGKPGFDSYLYDGYGHAVYDTAPDFRERALRWLK